MKDSKKKFRGLIHIHTKYSFDGSLSLPDFVNLVKNNRYEFIILTEHAEDFDDKKMQIVVSECYKATNEDFLVIPGLEFNITDEIHILGIGIEKYFYERDPEEIIRKIHENNGLAILAHVADCKKKIPYAQLKDVDFIEIWNPRYGEILSPSIKSIKVLREFRKMKKTYSASGGLDLHKLRDLVPVYQIVSSQRLTQKDILSSLKRGEFTTTNGLINFPPQKSPSVTMTAIIYLFALVQFCFNLSKKILSKISKMFKRHLANNFFRQ
jgi:hypothetical protein